MNESMREERAWRRRKLWRERDPHSWGDNGNATSHENAWETMGTQVGIGSVRDTMRTQQKAWELKKHVNKNREPLFIEACD